MIRKMTDRDIEDVARVWLDASLIAHDFVPAEFWHADLHVMTKEILPGANGYVFESQGEIVGFAALGAGQRSNFLGALFVRPDCQGKGIGTRLLDHVRRLHNPLKTSVYQQNERSVHFYKSRGFDVVGETVCEHTGCDEFQLEWTHQFERMTIVRASLDDVAMCVELFDGYRQSYGQSSDLDAARAFIVERLRWDESVIFLAVSDGIGCGFTQLYPSFSSVAMRPIWVLNDLFVTPEARRRGVAKRLMQTATEFVSENDGKRLVLATAVDNRPAQTLYENLGWVRDETFLHYNYEL